VRFLETLAAAPEAERRVRVPAITDPRGSISRFTAGWGQTPEMAALERWAIEALRAFGVLMTDTCINYQTIIAPVRGEHMAYGETGVVIYSNSVFGARSNFECGPSALAAALTGRTPRYGYHLDACRRATRRFRFTAAPRDLSEWGELGGIVGEACGSYWEVPVVEGIETVPGSDALKHFGTALASFGSVALFHMPGITAEEAVFAEPRPAPVTIGHAEIAVFLARHAAPDDQVDDVVFGAPQLSLFEMEAVAAALDGHRVHPDTTVIVATSPEIQACCRPHGSDAPHRGRGRDRRAGDLLLPELCAGDGRGQRLGPPDDQLRQARQHHRRLRLPAHLGKPGTLRRLRYRRSSSLMPLALRAQASHR